MRAALALALTFLAGSAHAIAGKPFVIGSNSAAAGSTTLLVTTTAACPVGNLVAVFLSQVGSTVATSSVSDGTSNIYLSNGTANGTSQRIGWFATRSLLGTKFAVPSGSTLTITYGVATAAEAAIAVCVPGDRQGAPNNDTAGPTATSAGSANPAVTPTANTGVGSITFAGTVLTGASADTWAESAGYTTLLVVNNVNKTVLSYQITYPGLTPAAYSATNGASRAWTVNTQSYLAAQCSLGSTGAGQC